MSETTDYDALAQRARKEARRAAERQFPPDEIVKREWWERYMYLKISSYYIWRTQSGRGGVK